ncbi:MAG: LysM peptidoglycan-binding domain-containing protein [bacterium]|nr:LysM peptidoglycan-binding domain-containing protein [bacterium]
MRNWLMNFLIFCMVFSGCGYIATREDVDITKEMVEDNLKKTEEKVIYIEKDYNQKIEKINSDLKEISDKILILSNEINNLKGDIKTIRGKIDELNFEYEGKLKKFDEDYEKKNFDLRRDIEGLKRTYNDLITTTSNINKNLSVIQTDIMNLRDSQAKMVESIQKLPQKIEYINEKVDKVEKRIENNTQIFLDEFTRHESEIYQLKKQILDKSSEIQKQESVKPILKSDKGKYYIVQKGDHLSKIAEKFNTSINEIKKLNNLKTDTVYPGQKLLIP